MGHSGARAKHASPESILRSAAEYGFRARPFGPSRNDRPNLYLQTQSLLRRVGRERLGHGRLVNSRRIAIRRHFLLARTRQTLARFFGLALAIPHAGVETPV